MQFSMKLRSSCIVVTISALFFMLVSISLPQWYTSSEKYHREDLDNEYGIFERCETYMFKRTCGRFTGGLMQGYYLSQLFCQLLYVCGGGGGGGGYVCVVCWVWLMVRSVSFCFYQLMH